MSHKVPDPLGRCLEQLKSIQFDELVLFYLHVPSEGISERSEEPLISSRAPV